MFIVSKKTIFALASKQATEKSSHLDRPPRKAHKSSFLTYFISLNEKRINLNEENFPIIALQFV